MGWVAEVTSSEILATSILKSKLDYLMKLLICNAYLSEDNEKRERK